MKTENTLNGTGGNVAQQENSWQWTITLVDPGKATHK